MGSWSRLLYAVALVSLVGATAGCARFPAQLGVRPNEPPAQPLHTKDDNARQKALCTEYEKYALYAQQLEESYHSRATQNRWWIYVAGIAGLGVAAASAGLAVAAAAGTTTLALLAISGGAAAGTFATLNNEDLAKMYTSAANRIDRGLQKGEESRLSDTEGKCGAALVELKKRVSAARRDLERSRTRSAAGALQRAVIERNELNTLIQRYQNPPPAAPPIPGVPAPATSSDPDPDD